MVFTVRILAITLSAGLLIFCYSGCSLLPKAASNPVPAESAAASNPTRYFVEMHPGFGKPKLYEGQITEPTTVQQALEVSGAMSEMNSMTVDLHRRLPDGGILKLPVDFKKGKQVKFEQDYSLHPNDRIVVRAKSNSPLDKVVDSLFSGRK